jgi:demethylmenaquinone methyltransferase/2-methoxy-6-polyprenyl-1,4-benzoquinol methylase
MFTKERKFISNMFDEISPAYDLLNHLFSGYRDRTWRKRAVKYMMNKEVKVRNVLDIASGSGDLAVEFLRLKPDKIFSVDISPKMLKINREKLNSKSGDSINIPVSAEAERLPFHDEFFDAAGIAFGVRNFENLDRCLDEIHRVLKPGARFIVIEMFGNRSNGFGIKLFKLYFNKIVPALGNFISKSNYAYDYLFDSVENFHTVEEFSDLLSGLGFEIENSENNFLGIVNTVISKRI